jgi:hypothetical protein
MNARCPAGRFFQLPVQTSIEDYVYQSDQDSFFAGIEFSTLSAASVNFTIRLQCGPLLNRLPPLPFLALAGR